METIQSLHRRRQSQSFVDLGPHRDDRHRVNLDASRDASTIRIQKDIWSDTEWLNTNPYCHGYGYSEVGKAEVDVDIFNLNGSAVS